MFWKKSQKNNPNLKESGKVIGNVEYILRDCDGNVKQNFTVPNLITNDGFDYIADAMANNASRPAVMRYIAIGSNATAANVANSALGSELDRKIGVYSHTVGTKVYTLDVTFTAGEGTGAVVESGMLNAAAAGDLLNRQTFPVINKGASDSLQVVWSITMS